MILWARHSGGGAPKISKKTVPTAHSDVDRQSRLKKTFDNILNKNLFERIIYFVIFLLVYTLLVFNGLGEYIKYLMKGFGLVERIIDGRDVIENILWLAFEIIIKLFPFYVLLKLFGHKKTLTIQAPKISQQLNKFYIPVIGFTPNSF